MSQLIGGHQGQPGLAKVQNLKDPYPNRDLPGGGPSPGVQIIRASIVISGVLCVRSGMVGSNFNS